MTFPLFAKIDVNGPNAHPLYDYLTRAKGGGLLGRGIKWNFTKFLVGRDGKVLARFGPTVKPEALDGEIADIRLSMPVQSNAILNVSEPLPWSGAPENRLAAWFAPSGRMGMRPGRRLRRRSASEKRGNFPLPRRPGLARDDHAEASRRRRDRWRVDELVDGFAGGSRCDAREGAALGYVALFPPTDEPWGGAFDLDPVWHLRRRAGWR